MKHARPINAGNSSPNISTGFSTNHPGIDYAYMAGTPVFASADGKVVFVKSGETRQWIANSASDPFLVAGTIRPLTNADYGNYMIVDHGDGHRTLYAHLLPNSPRFKVGDIVKKGQQIASIGSTGNSTGNHLHFELIISGVKSKLSDHFDSEFNNYYTGGNNMSNMYGTPNQYDLENAESMRVCVDTQNAVLTGKYIKTTEHDAQIKSLKDEFEATLSKAKADAYAEGLKAGGQTAVATPDPEKWAENGMNVEVTVGNVKTITNYSRKS